MISRAGGVIDLDDKKLERALRRGMRTEDDGWLEWEKKHAREIGLEVEEESEDDEKVVTASTKRASPRSSASSSPLTPRHDA